MGVDRASCRYMADQSAFTERVQDCVDRLSTAGVDALGALFDLTSQRLVRFAVALTRNQHDAEDAVQTALCGGQPTAAVVADDLSVGLLAADGAKRIAADRPTQKAVDQGRAI